MFFCSSDFLLLPPLLTSPRLDLNLSLSYFASVKLISPFFVLFKRLKALSNLSNFSSLVLPLYLYIKSSLLPFLANLVISSSLSSASLLNISFCFEINGVSSLS